MSNLKLKLNKKGYLDEFILDDTKLGTNITKIILILDPNKNISPKLILEYMGATEIEGDVEVEEKQVKQN